MISNTEIKGRAGSRSLQIVFMVIMIMISHATYAQKPPRPITVTKSIDLAFGAFYQGAGGGTVSVNSAGTRSTTGSVIPLGMGYPVTSSKFNVSGHPGTLVTILLGPDISLIGGGGSMLLHLDPNTNPVSPFVLSGGNPATVDLYIGGTLTVGTPVSNPPGSYSGTFTIIFNQN